MSEREQAVGLAAVLDAARLCQEVRAALVDGPDRLDKQDRSPVTVADFGSQALVCRRLREAFPVDPIVAEEDSALLRQPEHAAALRRVAEFVRPARPEADPAAVCRWIDLGAGEPAERFWTLDPIDGTKGFLRGDQYAVALALIERGRVEHAFLACPALDGPAGPGLVLAARRGGGTQAFALDGAALGPVRVSELADASAARLAESFEAAHTDHGLSADLVRTLGIAGQPLRMDSQAKYAALALGRADLYLRAPNPKTPDYRENLWDHAAGWLVVREAGGRISDVRGRELDWTRGRRLEANLGILASNGRLHDAVLAALGDLEGRPGGR